MRGKQWQPDRQKKKEEEKKEEEKKWEAEEKGRIKRGGEGGEEV